MKRPHMSSQARRPRTSGTIEHCDITAADVHDIPPTQAELDASRERWIDLATPGESVAQLNARMDEQAMQVVERLRRHRVADFVSKQRDKELAAERLGQASEGNPLDELPILEVIPFGKQPSECVDGESETPASETPAHGWRPRSEAREFLAKVDTFLASRVDETMNDANDGVK